MFEPPVLNEAQRRILKNFYETSDVTVSLDKSARKKIWDDFVTHRNIKNILHLQESIPTLYAEMEKALNQNRNIQPAVFSECVYTQALAEKLSLSVYEMHLENVKLDFESKLPNSKELNSLTVRYSFSNTDKTKTLYQAGGASGVDCALHSLLLNELTWIEMKEPYARTSEPDLPKYGEDGFLVSSNSFEGTYPQFKAMLEEQLEKKLNVFEHIGNNIAEFSPNSIEKAVTENYSGEKLAHVICTEDEDGKLVMLPSNHVAYWAKLEGEIRPSGRNSYSVWTPLRLLKILQGLGATFDDDWVRVPLSTLKISNARGSKKISRYKINPLFFIRSSMMRIEGQYATFPLNVVRQLNPSITAKMNFKGLKVSEVKSFYSELI
jgi:hypothetical protein